MFKLNASALNDLFFMQEMKVKDFAQKAELNVATVSACLNGRRQSVTKKTLRKLAKALGAKTCELIEEG